MIKDREGIGGCCRMLIGGCLVMWCFCFCDFVINCWGGDMWVIF